MFSVLERFLELGVTDVGFVGVVGVGVAVAHEGDDVGGSLALVEIVEFAGDGRDVLVGILKEGNTELQDNGCQVIVVDVTVGVVGEVLDVVDHAGVFLARDDLQRLDHDLFVHHALLGEGGQPERRCVVVADLGAVGGVLTGSRTVDADGGREGEVHVILGESLPVGLHRGVEGIEGLLPGGTEGD